MKKRERESGVEHNDDPARRDRSHEMIVAGSREAWEVARSRRHNPKSANVEVREEAGVWEGIAGWMRRLGSGRRLKRGEQPRDAIRQ